MSEWSTRLWRSQTLAEGLHIILGGDIELLGADKGHVQLLDESGAALQIAAPARLRARVHSTSFRVTIRVTPASVAVRFDVRERIIVEDIETRSRNLSRIATSCARPNAAPSCRRR